jgi:signal transduction histidine kinase/DNA-binding NarL/FixJ family response regulator
MNAQQRIVRVRRNYNQWVANQTLEDYALRFTAKSARKWSIFRIANTAFGAISFLALEAIGGAITVSYGFTNAAAAIMVVGLLIFATGLPISYYAAKYGVDIDLLTRGAGFGYLGSTVTSLIYASFTFLFFAIEAAIMALALEMCFDVPLALGYIISSIVIIPIVTHGVTWISRFQLWTQPIWIGLHILPFVFIAAKDMRAFYEWPHYEGVQGSEGFNILLFGAAATVSFALIAQIGEQVDFLRFLPRSGRKNRLSWWAALIATGPGWIIPGALKMLAGSFLAFLAIRYMLPPDKAIEPTQMYLVAFRYVFTSPDMALAFTGAFVIISQLKINVTNAYAGSIAWSNFFSRLTHSHPGRVVWLVFNVAIALLLMELGVYKALERILGFYSLIALAWVGALVADLVINKPLRLSPRHIEFKRAHLYDINPVGVGAMLIAAAAAIASFAGLFGDLLQALASFIALGVAFVAAPLIAIATKGRYYLARGPSHVCGDEKLLRCCICEYEFETEDMATCPAYAGPICSLCCSLDARCNDVCKPQARLSDQLLAGLGAVLPRVTVAHLNSRLGHYLGIISLFSLVIGAILALIYVQATLDQTVQHDVIRATLWMVFFIFLIIAGVAAWLFVLAQESRRVAQEESARQTNLLMQEIEAHTRTDAELQKAKEAAEAANRAKSRYLVGISHELRTPLSAILGYAQLLERDTSIPSHRRDAIRVVRRSAEHLSGLIDGLLDLSRIEIGKFQLNRDEVRFTEFLDQIVDMFRLQATTKNLQFIFERPKKLPAVVYADEKQLRQILINLLSNAIKFTDVGHVALRVTYRGQVAEFEVADTGIGIGQEDIERIFEPFERGRPVNGRVSIGTGLGLTITKLLTKVMGGDLTVESEIGKGALFRVKLLMSEVSRPRSATPIERSVRGYRGPRRTVLVADDEADHRELIREILAPLGFTIFSAPDGPTSLELTSQCDPDIALLDISMPGLNGWDVARRLRDDGKRTRIIMLSANANDVLPDQEEARLFDAYMMKPLVIQQLLDTIKSLLQVEWTYEKEANPVPALPRPPAISPSSEHISDLLRLGQIGYVRGIQAKLIEIERESLEHEVFVAELRDIIRNFDLKRYMSVLEAIKADDAR